MKIKLLLIVSICIGFISALTAEQFTVKDVSLDDLEQIMEIDRQVSFEHFLPLYPLMYAGSWIGNNPHESLSNDLIIDKKNLEKAINHEDSTYLIAAFNNETNVPVGFLWFSKIDDKTIGLELLLVLKEYRNKGVGKQLVTAAINYFSTTKYCYAETHRNYNENTLKFYEKMGFVNQGPTPRQDELPGGVLISQVLDRLLYQRP